ncbi:class I SAM-dependent methyltransferase [Sulfidibacter corallicola]|uniref:Class I SAM-dependent methyltransferase n=1 Tax=Sulfidibacter corallicola TaxID=2818388 RepID=A0A8A4TGP0_SULCO|nr:class I SAM-dependent methyltransferase [Sulfidibacter corallicola]QTD48687.1 class I SAM-dependent methyltransferase [Sulfidibacter corallicola]
MKNRFDKSVRFWDRHADSYAKKAIDDPDAYEKKLAITREYLTPESAVLEFGCGTGSTALTHAARVKHIIAIDTSLRMIEIAQTKAQAKGVTNVAFSQATVFDLPHQAASFDVVLGLNVIHLVADIEATIARCHELLKPGGVFISSTSCIARANLFLKWLLPIGGNLGLIPRVQIFDNDYLTGAMTRAGFEIAMSQSLNKSGMTWFVIAKKRS